MKAEGYYEKRDRAVRQDAAVKRVKEKDAAPKGAKAYIELRLQNLKKVRGY